MSKLRNTSYLEFRTIDKPDVVVKTSTRLIGPTTINTGIDSVPTLSLTIPLEDLPIAKEEQSEQYIELRLQRYTIIAYFNIGGVQKYRFQGTIDKMNIDYASYSVQLTLSHTVARMREWAMPANYSVKTKTVEEIISERGAALGYANPPVLDSQGNENFSMQNYEYQTIDFVFENDGSKDVLVTMTFGSNNKLQALSELLNNTEDLHFTVDLSKERDTVIIGSFSKECTRTVVSPYTYTAEECEDEDLSEYVTMLTEPKFNVDYTGHFNRAIVFCGDVQDGVNHLTLEPYYGTAPIEGFPIGKYEYELNQLPETVWDSETGKKINNEKVYKDFEIIAYSKNGNREYYVEDTEQLKRDNYIILNTTYNFNDLYPIPQLKLDIDDDGEMEELVITDGDRAEIVRQAYMRAVRKLKAQRPERTYQMNTTALPLGTSDGDKIRLQYTKSVHIPDEDDPYDEECATKEVKIVNIDEYLYLTKRTITFDEALNEITTVTLDGELRPKDISATEVELREAAAEEGNYEQAKIHSDLGRRTYYDTLYREYQKQWLGDKLKAPNLGAHD